MDVFITGLSILKGWDSISLVYYSFSMVTFKPVSNKKHTTGLFSLKVPFLIYFFNTFDLYFPG